MQEPETLLYHCNFCGHSTKHDLIAKRRHEKPEDNGEPSTSTWEMLECRGCEAVSVRHKSWWSPQNLTNVYDYPPRVSRRPPMWSWKLPVQVHELLTEVYVCIHNDTRRVALMGARGILDLVMGEQVGDAGTFKQRLSELEKRGAIGRRNREILEVALDAGSAASHRGYQASPTDLNSVMDIIENLLQAVYQLPAVASKLKLSTPPRNSPKQ